MKLLLLVTVAILVIDKVRSFPGGPPVGQQVCVQMLPGHGPAPQQGNGGFVIDTNLTRIDSTSYSYTAGQTYSGEWRAHAMTASWKCLLFASHKIIVFRSCAIYSYAEERGKHYYISRFSGDRAHTRSGQQRNWWIYAAKREPADVELRSSNGGECSRDGRSHEPSSHRLHEPTDDMASTTWFQWNGWFQVNGHKKAQPLLCSRS